VLFLYTYTPKRNGKNTGMTGFDSA